jgi:hydrogenase expression/formation protein HypE
MMGAKRILLGHGSGGRLSHRLLTDLFLRYFENRELAKLNDGARLDFPGKSLVFSTDSYVVDPIFFPGGDIGRLAVCGTVNDVAMMGAKPLYLSAAFIIEEGFLISELEIILASMKEAAAEAEVELVTGDTKVVPKSAADKIFITTAGIGLSPANITLSGQQARPGEKIVINGTIADHGITVMARREGLNLDVDLQSDCAPLNHLVNEILEAIPSVSVMRDPTRGGVATTLNEIAHQSGVSIRLFEDHLPVTPAVNAVCEILGLDPLYIANEGKLLVFVADDFLDDLLNLMHQHKYGRNACLIGEVKEAPAGKVFLKTSIGSERLIDMLSGEQLPRIC